MPLKKYSWKKEVYTDEQINNDRSKLGWIAQDVEQVFPKAVNSSSFSYDIWKDVDIKQDGIIVKEKQLDSRVTIDDCKNLNTDQIYAVMYGAIKKLIDDVERLTSNLEQLKRG